MLFKIKCFFKSNLFKSILQFILELIIDLFKMFLAIVIITNAIYLASALIDYVPVDLDFINTYKDILFII